MEVVNIFGFVVGAGVVCAALYHFIRSAIPSRIAATAWKEGIDALPVECRPSVGLLEIHLQGISRRIQQEIGRLTTREHLNLAIAVLLGFFGLANLASLITAWVPPPTQPVQQIQITDSSFLSVIVPRAGLTILVEIFAFYYLGLYRDAIDAIQGLHDEHTTIELKFMALCHAIVLNCNVSHVIATIAESERSIRPKVRAARGAIVDLKLLQEAIKALFPKHS